jgi:hypothetical protein
VLSKLLTARLTFVILISTSNLDAQHHGRIS